MNSIRNEERIKSKNKKGKRDLILSGNLINAIIYISVPMMLIAFIQPMGYIIDNLFISKIGDTQLAAVGFANPIINFATAFGVGLGYAGIALIGQCLGRKDDEEANIISIQLIVFSIIIGSITALIVIVYGQFVLKDLKGQLFLNTQIYLFVISLGIPLNFFNSIYAAIKRAYGDAIKPLHINIFSLVLKSALNFFAIFVLHKSFLGIAYATIVTNIIIVCIECIDLFMLNTAYKLTFKNFKFYKSNIWMFIKLGVPSALSGASSQLSFILINRQAISYGESVLTAYSIANSINSLFFSQVGAVGTALATIVSQNIGASQVDRAKEATRKATLLSFILSIFFAIFLIVFSRPMVELFTHSPEIIYYGTNAMQIYSISVIAWSIFQTQLGAFIGIGQTKVPLYATIIRIWVIRIPFVYLCQLINPEMKEFIIWYSMLISNIGVTVFTIFKLKHINWKYKLSI